MKKFLLFVAAALTSFCLSAEEYEWSTIPGLSFASTDNAVTVRSTTNFSYEQKQMASDDTNPKLWGIKIASSANSVLDTSYIEIDCAGEISALELGVSNCSTSDGYEYAVVFCDEAPFNSSATLSPVTATSINRNATSDTHQTITVPAGAQSARIYRKITIGGTSYGKGSSVDMYYLKVTVGAAVTKYTVTYYDGTTVLGTESVKENETPANYANYQSKAHATFDGWYNEAAFTTSADFSAAITADKAFYGKWTAEAFTASSSLNIEQGVLDNSKAWDINSALTQHNILVNDKDALDSLNSSKDANNEPYLGLKMKKATSYVEVGLNAGDVLRVKFGNIGCALKATASDLDSTIATDAAKVFEYTAAAQGYVKIANTVDAKTVTLKQIMINDTIQAVNVEGGSTPTPTPAAAAAVLYEAVFSNGVKGAIYNDTVAVPYVGEIPSFVSDSVSAGATAAFADNKITVTNDTVNHVYDVLFVALTAPAFSADTVTFNGSETAYIYDHYGFDAEKGWKFSKNLNESSNMRITEGKTRLYMALPACDSVELVSAATARDIVVYLNGVLTSVTNSGSFKLALDSTKVNFVAIESNQTKGDGGFSKMLLFKSGSTPEPEPEPVVVDTVEFLNLKGVMKIVGSTRLFEVTNDSMIVSVGLDKDANYLNIALNQNNLSTAGTYIKKMELGSLQTIADGSNVAVAITKAGVIGWFAGYGLYAGKLIHVTFTYTDKTALDEISAQGKAQKYLENGKLYILKGGKVYDAAGHVVK